MTRAKKSSAAKSGPARSDFNGLVALRRQWRLHHEKQERENADRVFRQAGVEQITEIDLKFFPLIFRQKLNEFGRDWERALAAQALREGFSFYRVPLTIGVDEVNALYEWLETALHSNGASLFFESNGVQALHDGVWDSIFYFTLNSTIAPESLEIEKAPGARAVGKILRIA